MLCYDRLRINNSDVQCRWPSVNWSVYFNFITFFCQNYFLLESMGVHILLVEIPEGWGGHFCVQKKWKFRGGGGGEAYIKFPPWWGYGYFLELHI